MAEHSFANLAPGTHSIPRAEVNRVGSGWAGSLGVAQAFDGSFHPPMPQVDEPAPPAPPAPQPTEAETRDQLEAAQQQQRRADEAVQQAQAVHARALERLEACRHAVQAFDSLNTDALSGTLEALRGAGPVEVPAALRERMRQRHDAQADLALAEQAAEVLAAELAIATEEAARIARECHRLTVTVLGFTADRLVDQRADLLRQGAGLFNVLLEFDRYAANANATLSQQLVTLLMSAGVPELARERDVSAWQRAAEQLHADPHAEITITPVPPRPRVIDNTRHPGGGMKWEDAQRLALGLPLTS